MKKDKKIFFLKSVIDISCFHTSYYVHFHSGSIDFKEIAAVLYKINYNFCTFVNI